MMLNVEEISDGGERVTHLDRGASFYAHLSIYDFALQFCRDAVVLDAGSGAGYGSAHLARSGAKQVWGIDISEKAVDFSRHHFQEPNLTYQVMNLDQIEGFEPRSFDFIFSSNTLEHVPNVASFLSSAWQLLRPSGALLLAVPPITDDRLLYLNIINRYHVNLWSPRQWFHALGLFLQDVECYLHGVESIGRDFKPKHLTQTADLTEADFLFEQCDVADMYRMFTLTAIFLARRPRPESQVPVAGTPLGFVDDSFTRPEGYISPEMRLRLKRYFDMPEPPSMVWSGSRWRRFSVRRKIRDSLALIAKKAGR